MNMMTMMTMMTMKTMTAMTAMTAMMTMKTMMTRMTIMAMMTIMMMTIKAMMTMKMMTMGKREIILSGKQGYLRAASQAGSVTYLASSAMWQHCKHFSVEYFSPKHFSSKHFSVEHCLLFWVWADRQAELLSLLGNRQHGKDGSTPFSSLPYTFG